MERGSFRPGVGWDDHPPGEDEAEAARLRRDQRRAEVKKDMTTAAHVADSLTDAALADRLRRCARGERWPSIERDAFMVEAANRLERYRAQLDDGRYHDDRERCPACESVLDDDGYCTETGCRNEGKTPTP